MPSLCRTPLTGAALKEFYDRQAEMEGTRTYTDKSIKREEEGYLSDTILDQVLSGDDYTCSSETPLVDHHTVLPPSSLDSRKRQNETSMPYEDEQFDTMIGSNDGVNSRIGAAFENTLQNQKRFKSNHAYHEQAEEKQESDEDEAICCTNDTTPPSAPLTEGKQGCEIKQKKLVGKRSSFEKRFDQLEAYKAKHGNCNVKTNSTSDDRSLGRWCLKVRQSVKKMKNNEALIVAGLTEENIKRLEDIGFKFNPQQLQKCCLFEKRFNELEAYKAKHGHCNVKRKSSGNDKSLGNWCSTVRQAMKKMKNNEALIVAGLSEENIQRLKDIGFKFNLKNEYWLFEKRFSDLEAYKAKHGHCNLKTTSTAGHDKSLGIWCWNVRRSMKKMKNNEAPIVAGLTEENIQRLEDIGFDCNTKKYSFEEYFGELEAYKAKHGHCKVNTKSVGDDRSLGNWCSNVRTSLKRMKNNEAPIVAGLSEENIQRLKDIGFKFNPKSGKPCSSEK